MIAKSMPMVKERDHCRPITAAHKLVDCGETLGFERPDGGAEAVNAKLRVEPQTQFGVIDVQRPDALVGRRGHGMLNSI